MFNESDQLLVIYQSHDASTDVMNAVTERPTRRVDAESDEIPADFCDYGPLVARTVDGAFVSEWPEEDLCEGERWTITQDDVDNRSDKVPGLEGPYWTVDFADSFGDWIAVYVYSGRDRVAASSPMIGGGSKFFGDACTDPMAFYAVIDEKNETGGTIGNLYIAGPTTCPLGSTWTIAAADLDDAEPWEWPHLSQS